MYYVMLAVMLAIGYFGALGTAVVWNRYRRRSAPAVLPRVDVLIQRHFHPISLNDLRIAEREFPFHVRADLQQAMARHFDGNGRAPYFTGVRREYHHGQMSFADLLHSEHYPAQAVPPEFEELDIGDERPVCCLKNGLWLTNEESEPLAILVTFAGTYGEPPRLKVQVATRNDPAASRRVERFFQALEEGVRQAASYRGKILSLEASPSYSGMSTGITVHKLRFVTRDQIILPLATLELLERNVLRFIDQRAKLAALGLSTKKGLLFYGPPGTGKTHTIHYLSRALPGHTMLLISAEQVGLLDMYMTLARLLQPSVVVLEDVDLIARNRADMNSVCEEVLLNKLLNEMDGLKENVDVIFILTTNRPEALEFALASRPGRIDQAIEFPVPDEAGREKLVRLYAGGIELAPGVMQSVVARTEGVSAAFIKELLRRATQFHLERAASNELEWSDIEEALNELLFRGGPLNRMMLGAQREMQQS
ncbi:MAG TPA: ATP-binding protein [Pirellulales bacterium]|nr:ATP-binding protein [Pirellulales bacterium]